MGDDAADSFADVAQFRGAVGAEAGNVLGGADGLVDDGALPCLELEGQPHAFKRQEQVGEDDGGIDAQFLGGGDGDFRGKLRLLADFKQGVVPADGLVLRHVAAGLAQEPDRGAIDRFPQAGAQKAGAAGEGFCRQSGARSEVRREDGPRIGIDRWHRRCY